MPHHPPYSPFQRGWALAELMIAISLMAVLAAVALSRSDTQEKTQKTLLIGQQALDLQNAIQRYMATHGGTVPSAGQLIAESQVPAHMVSGDGQRILHAGRSDVDIGKMANALGDGRMGFLLSIGGLDASACRTVVHQIAERFPGVLVTNTADDDTCTSGCHQIGEIARDFGGDLAAYEAARGPASQYVKGVLANSWATLTWMNWASSTFDTQYGGVSPFGADVRRSKEPHDSTFNLAWRDNLAAACPANGSGMLYTLKLISTGS
jgi:prepilin-type N-terminal cleavage/methylation domain-containing protein